MQQLSLGRWFESGRSDMFWLNIIDFMYNFLLSISDHLFLKFWLIYYLFLKFLIEYKILKYLIFLILKINFYY